MIKMSAVYRRKRIGSRTEPWVTPQEPALAHALLSANQVRHSLQPGRWQAERQIQALEQNIVVYCVIYGRQIQKWKQREVSRVYASQDTRSSQSRKGVCVGLEIVEPSVTNDWGHFNDASVMLQQRWKHSAPGGIQGPCGSDWCRTFPSPRLMKRTLFK